MQYSTRTKHNQAATRRKSPGIILPEELAVETDLCPFVRDGRYLNPLKVLIRAII